jgi:alkylation response protein AidB-like acyl-CoA dehydrogenase
MIEYLTEREKQIFREVCEYIDTYSDDHDLMHEAETGEHIFGGPESRRFVREFAAKGWLVPNWPREYGGLDSSEVLNFAIRNALSRAGIPAAFMAAHMAGDMIMEYGSDYLKETFLGPIARGEIEFAVGYSEPGAGSDMLSLKMKAEDKGDHYLVNGQKVFNTHAHVAEYHWLAVRTDPTAPNHKAISILLVDMDSPGITVRPMVTIAGSRTNEVFYDDVKVPKSRLVGEENQGIRYLMGQLARERMFPPGQHERYFESLLERVKQLPDSPEKQALRIRLAESKIELEASRLLYERCPVMMDQGISPDIESSLEKLFMSDTAQKLSKLGMDIHRADGFATPDAGAGGLTINAVDKHLANIVLTIYGGASEIQKNILAQRGLGLPRIK